MTAKEFFGIYVVASQAFTLAKGVPYGLTILRSVRLHPKKGTGVGVKEG